MKRKRPPTFAAVAVNPLTCVDVEFCYITVQNDNAVVNYFCWWRKRAIGRTNNNTHIKDPLISFFFFFFFDFWSSCVNLKLKRWALEPRASEWVRALPPSPFRNLEDSSSASYKYLVFIFLWVIYHIQSRWSGGKRKKKKKKKHENGHCIRLIHSSLYPFSINKIRK